MTGHSLLRWQSPTTTRGSRSPGTLQKGTKRIWCCCLTWWLLLLIIYMMTKYAAENMDLYCCSLDERLFIIHSAPLPWKLPMISNWQMPLLTNVIIDKCHHSCIWAGCNAVRWLRYIRWQYEFRLKCPLFLYSSLPSIEKSGHFNRNS